MITNVLEAIAYLAMAFMVNNLFTATETTVLGQRRAGIMVALLSGALVQTMLVAVSPLGVVLLNQALDLIGAVCLLAVPLSFWPVVRRISQGHMRVVNRRLLSRVRRAEVAADQAQKWLGMAEQTGHVGHWQLTVPDNELIWSDEVYRIHGLWHEHYKPRIESALAAFHPLDGKRIGALLLETVTAGDSFEVAARLRRPDGEIRHVIMRGLAQFDVNGRVDALNGVMVDVTEPKRAEARLQSGGLRDLPLEDSLTGLADRKQFDLSLGYEFKRAVRSRKPLGMVLIEIDQFSRFVAHYGTVEGDGCLRAVAQAVQAVPRRTGDVVARFSETEIAVLLPLADGAGAYRVATQIAEAIRALGVPTAGAQSDVVTASCGAAAFVGMDDLYNPLELTRRAARALAEAQAAGGARVAAYRELAFAEVLAPSARF